MERFAIKIDKKLRANLYKICRLCGMDNPDMVPILSDNERNKDENCLVDLDAELEMSQKINLLIGLSITKDDRMPQTMCGLCVDKINDFYEFREMCYATNTQTRKLLGLKAVKNPTVDIKPKLEVKQEEEIVPTPISSKNVNRKRKSDEVGIKEESLTKKKLRLSASSTADAVVKDEISGVTKKKLRFSTTNDEMSSAVTATSNKLKKEPTPPIVNINKKSKLCSSAEDKLKKESSPPTSASLATAGSNKKLRIVAHAQKEAATSKKSKQKGNKNLDSEVKEEIKEEIKEEPAVAPEASESLPTQKFKFGCNICSERYQSKGKLEAHVRTVHLPKIERYVCTACNEVLSKSFDIKNHQLWHKLSKTPYVCSCCGESILNTYAFSRHLREHAFETPPALLVLDRECPQCHTSYATNFLYNIHTCALKTRRCAGCNRLQRNESEYLRHSAHCAKVYLNYSKHIMPSVEALEDSVRIKNENDVEAAAEEMARLSGVSLDMAPVVQLTRLSSPIIMAANQCVSIPGLDDSASTSSKKSGKKGMSKKDLKRVDELLKSTLDALVSIKHEPEVHVEQETPSIGEHSDNDDRPSGVEDDHATGLDDFHHNDEDSDNENGTENITKLNDSEKDAAGEAKQIKIKQEIEEGNEENSNKIGFGLKLKIKKEHGQLNSSIIEQHKSTEKRAEKRKKKKKHKDKEKNKQKLSKDMPDEQVSQDSNANNNVEQTVCIKTEPQDETEAADIASVTPLQIRPQPEATIMTSIPMMQFQIACVSSGVDFNNSNNQQNQEVEEEDVKPNRAELDRLMKISHVSSGVAMQTDQMDETEENQTMEDDNTDDYREDNNEDDYHDDNDNESQQRDDGKENDEEVEVQEENEETNVWKRTEISEVTSEKLPKLKPTLKPKQKPVVAPVVKSRNKACKSTAKSANLPIFQISAVQSCVALGPSSLTNPAPDESNFVPIFIKPEPQNRGYSDEQSASALNLVHPNAELNEVEEAGLLQTHNVEEQNYISSIDFNNIVIKQEKDIEINDVQTTKKKLPKAYADFNGVKRKRKQIRYSHIDKDKTNENDDKNEDENYDDDDIGEDDGYEETDVESEDDEYNMEDAEAYEEEDEDVEEEEEEQEDEEEEEREYRELEYPPQINAENNTETEEKENLIKEVNENYERVEKSQENQQQSLSNKEEIISEINRSVEENSQIPNSSTQAVKPSSEITAFIISSVCSQAVPESKEPFELIDSHRNLNQVLNNPESKSFISTTVIDSDKINPDCVINTQTSFLTNEGENITGINSCLMINCDKVNHSLCETIKSDPTTDTMQSTLPSDELHAAINSREKNLQLSQQFKINYNDQISQELSSEKTLELNLQNYQESDYLTIQTTQYELMNQGLQEQKQIDLEKRCKFSELKQVAPTMQTANDDQLMQKKETCTLSLDNTSVKQIILDNKIQVGDNVLHCHQNIEGASNHDLNSQCLLTEIDGTTLLTSSQNASHISSEVKHDIQQILKHAQEPVLKITSVTTAAELDDFNKILSKNDVEDLGTDNREETTATVEGFVKEFKYKDLEAQPAHTEITQHDTYQNEYMNDLQEEDDNTDHNLEEQQNYQNLDILSQIRPAALALHPYLEDISSSSNSLLSNSLSQTPPPPSTSNTSTASVKAFNVQEHPQQLLNNEETDNILNESNDILSRQSLRSSAGTSTPLPSHLAQQTTNARTFNFDNINEIAENNNNANIEREQLQDEQQQQVSNNVT